MTQWNAADSDTKNKRVEFAYVHTCITFRPRYM